jgi:hypothetical protein
MGGPRTPPDGQSIEEAHAKMLAHAAPMQYESAPVALKAAAMARALGSHGHHGFVSDSKPRGKTFMMPSVHAPRAPFAFASPAQW